MTIPLAHTYVKTNGTTLHTVTAGPEDGPLVILLHGFPEFWYGWREQIPALAAAGYRVWAPDQRGYNLSDKPRGIAPYNLDELAADVVGLVEASGRGKVHLVGHDWGAAVAWWVGVKYPQRLHRLGILNVPHPIVMRRYMRAHPKQLLKSWYIFVFQLPWLAEHTISTDNFEVGTEMLKATSRQGSFTEADMERYRRAWGQPYALTGMINWYRATARTKTERLDSLRVTVPTRIIWGVHDVALSREMAPLSLEMCDEGDLHFIEDATHWVQHDEPHRVNELLLEFLGS